MMMSTTTANMGLSVPTLNGDSGVWDTAINASLALIDTHNHTTGQGVVVPSAGIGINAALTFAGFAATNLKGTSFTPQASSPGLNYVWVKTSDNELYFSDELARDVKLTSNGAVNIAAVGGIVGDYASAAAAFYYDNAAKSYLALQAAPAPNVWASVSAGEVDIYEKASGIATRVRLASPAALAASYQVTFPAAVPASNALVQVSSTGVMTFSNTVTKAVTMTELTTFSAGATAAAGQHFTVSTTGEYKHGTKRRPVAANAGDGSGFTMGDGKITASGACTFWVPLTLEVGERITGCAYTIDGDGAVTFTVSVDHYSATGVKTQIGAAAGTTPNATVTTYAIAGLTATTLANYEVVVVKYTFSGANGVLYTTEPSFTRP